jgi:hypothetical protein
MMTEESFDNLLGSKRLPSVTVLLPRSFDEDLAAFERSEWTVAPIDLDGQCPLPAKAVPTPPFFNVELSWDHVTGAFAGIRFFQDAEPRAQAAWVDHGDVWLADGTLSIWNITCLVEGVDV